MDEIVGPTRRPLKRGERAMAVLFTGGVVLVVVALAAVAFEHSTTVSVGDCRPINDCPPAIEVMPPSSVADFLGGGGALRGGFASTPDLVAVVVLGARVESTPAIPVPLRGAVSFDALMFLDGSTTYSVAIEEVVAGSTRGDGRAWLRLSAGTTVDTGDRWLVALFREPTGSYRLASEWTAIDLDGRFAELVAGGDDGFPGAFTPEALLTLMRAEADRVR